MALLSVKYKRYILLRVKDKEPRDPLLRGKRRKKRKREGDLGTKSLEGGSTTREKGGGWEKSLRKSD